MRTNPEKEMFAVVVVELPEEEERHRVNAKHSEGRYYRLSRRVKE